MKTLSQILKEGRDKADLTAEQAGLLIGVGERAVQSIESGHTAINDQKLTILTNAYGIHNEVSEYFSRGGITNLTWQDHLRRLQPSNIAEALLVLADVAKEIKTEKNRHVSLETDKDIDEVLREKKNMGNQKTKKHRSDTDGSKMA